MTVLARDTNDGIPTLDHHDRTNDHAIANVGAILTTSDETDRSTVYLRVKTTLISEHKTDELRIGESSDSHLHLRLLIGEGNPIGIVGRQ